MSDWHDDEPHPLSAQGGAPEADGSGEPAVRALTDAGWHLAPDAPVWSFLPAVWPAGSRTWVPDRVERVITVYDDGEPRTAPLPAADRADLEADADRLSRDAGVGPRPAGRLWLLQPVQGWSPEQVCDEAVARAEARGVPVVASPALTVLVREVLSDASGGTRP